MLIKTKKEKEKLYKKEKEKRFEGRAIFSHAFPIFFHIVKPPRARHPC